MSAKNIICFIYIEFVGFDVIKSDIQELFKTIFTTYKGLAVLFFCIFICHLIIFLKKCDNIKIGNIEFKILIIINIVILFILLPILSWFKIKQKWLFILLNVILGILIILSFVLMSINF